VKHRPPALVIGVVATFLAAIAYLIATSLVPRTAAEFTFDPPVPRASDDLVGVDTITISAPDDAVWRFVDLERRALLAPPDTAGWDLAVRRFNVIASAEAMDLGTVSFDGILHATAIRYRPAADSTLSRWYRYSYLSHLLQPNGHVYALRTREGNEWKVEFLSYYCTGMVPGCVTFRYSAQ
jgi:hypothetical protein